MATKPTLDAERLGELYTAFNEGDIETVVSAMAEDITWFEPEGDPYAGTYHSPDEVVENVFAPVPEDFESFTLDVHRVVEEGEMLVVEGAYEITSNAGTDHEISFAHVWRTRDGLLQEFRNYTDTALMQEAVEA